MTLLKEDGSLDVERMNSLPLEEWMDEMGAIGQQSIDLIKIKRNMIEKETARLILTVSLIFYLYR